MGLRRGPLTGSDRFDAVVIGGGPAGAAAATAIARAGARVALISARRRPQRCTKRGETLSPASAPVLDRLGFRRAIDRLRFPPVTGFLSAWGAPDPVHRSAMLLAGENTLLLDRPELDAALAAAAAKANVELISAEATVVKNDGSWWEIQLNGRRAIRGAFLIDASGRGAHFMRRLGAELIVVDKLVAVAASISRDADVADHAVRVQALEGGWIYTVPETSGTRYVAFFTDGDLLRDRTKTSARCLLAAAVRRAPVVHAVIPCESWRTLRPRIVTAASAALVCAHGPRIVAVGDAAQTLDPLSSQGIAAALEDGESAGIAVVRDLCGEETALREHEWLRRKRIVEYLRKRLRYYSFEQRWENFCFWTRRRDVTSLARLASGFR